MGKRSIDKLPCFFYPYKFGLVIAINHEQLTIC